MKKTVKHSILAALAVTLGLCASVSQAQTNVDRVYVIDQRGQVAKSNFGLCWRTNAWTPAAAAKDPAGCECDRDLIEKSVCDKVAPPGGKPLPPTVAKPDNTKVSLPADVLFDFNKAILRPAGKVALDDVIAKARSLNLGVVIAVGHADRIGGAAYNKKLSERRAAAVKEYAVSKGIPANRIYTEGKGSTQPVTKAGQCGMGKTKAVIDCLQPDRRVAIEIIGTRK